jgi:hypothetical protein
MVLATFAETKVARSAEPSGTAFGDDQRQHTNTEGQRWIPDRVRSAGLSGMANWLRVIRAPARDGIK